MCFARWLDSTGRERKVKLPLWCAGDAIIDRSYHACSAFELSDDGMMLLGRLLASNFGGCRSHLRELRLDGAQIGIAGCLSLGAALGAGTLPGHEALDLSDNPIDAHAVNSLVAGPHPIKLQRLDHPRQLPPRL